jgi:hypothetical protein
MFPAVTEIMEDVPRSYEGGINERIAGPSGHTQCDFSATYSVRDRRINFPPLIAIVPTPESLRYSVR